jgi:pimeloyl-ACP methyl ester carboxylesterase
MAIWMNLKEKLSQKKSIRERLIGCLEVLLPHHDGEHNIRMKRDDLVSSTAERYGFSWERHNVKTADGWILCLDRIRKIGKEPGEPIILQHGLFQSGGVFVVGNGSNSPAFFLAEQGFDVWLGNNRGVYPTHQSHSPSHHGFWDWSLDDLGKHDFPSIVTYVNNQTSKKVVYVGHSQGNAQAFIGLTNTPELGDSVGLFIALAPAYYVNSFKHWTLQLLQKMSEEHFDTYFGKFSFVSIMHRVQESVPKRLFSSLAYNVYSYIFDWSDRNWRIGQKPMFFQTTPRPISVKLAKHWMHISRNGLLTPLPNKVGDNSGFSSGQYTLDKIRCPVAVFYGGNDLLVDGRRLHQNLTNCGATVVHAEEIPKYEHMDLIWGETAIDTVWKRVAELARRVK